MSASTQLLAHNWSFGIYLFAIAGVCALMLLLSWLMVSKRPYPSFKGLSWRTKRSIPWLIGACFLIMMIIYKWRIMPAVLFVGYLLYGLVRPWVSREWRREIEDDPDEPEDGEEPLTPWDGEKNPERKLD